MLHVGRVRPTRVGRHPGRPGRTLETLEPAAPVTPPNPNGTPHVKIDRDAAPFVALASLPAATALLRGHRAVALGLGMLPAAVTAFFRDPDRPTDLGASFDLDTVVAPADGKLMHAGPAEPGMAPPGDWQQITIFLSLADVHINRAAYGGRVEDVTYRPGRFLAAFTAESGTENERSEITVVADGPDGPRRVVYRQVVGLLARRVVTRVSPGDVTTTGQRIGLMKFGSRMDIFVPPEVELHVAAGERTVAGETVLATWPAGGMGSPS